MAEEDRDEMLYPS